MKNLVVVIFALGFVFYACGSEEPSTSDNKTITAGAKPDGEKIYQKTCSVCHGAFGEPVLAIAGDLRNPELTLEQRIETITNGSQKDATMIAFKEQFSEKEIKAIAEYTMGFIE